nr:hypothetical protein [Tanacetum cinerariifolium]
MHDEFEMSMMGENFFLGLQIKQIEDEIFFNQSKYVKEMLKKFGLEDFKPTKTPMSTEIKLTTDDEVDFMDSSKYRENPKTTHLEAVKRMFRYIRGTSHFGLRYPKGTRIETIVYADSDHKQTDLAISMTEAEYVSARKACQQAVWMKQALIDYDIRLDDFPIRISLLYRGEYSQWVKRFINYLEEQTDGEAMINSIKNGDQSLPLVTQVSIAGTSSTEQPHLKDKSMWSDQEKRIQKIDSLARSLLIQGLLNDIYSLIDSNKTAKDLWDALARHMLGFEYGEQDRKAAVLFMNYLEEQTDGEAMINSIKNGDQPLSRVTQVSISGTSSNELPHLKDKSMWSDQEKRIQKINRLARSLLIQGLPNDIYYLIDSNKTTKDLWDAFA